MIICRISNDYIDIKYLNIYVYRHKIQIESDRNTELELTLTKLENHIKELENKIEILKAEELHQANNYLVEVILFNCFINYW